MTQLRTKNDHRVISMDTFCGFPLRQHIFTLAHVTVACRLSTGLNHTEVGPSFAGLLYHSCFEQATIGYLAKAGHNIASTC